MVHLAAEQDRVFVKRYVWLVTKAMDPTHTINESALNVMQPVVLCPGEAFIEGPVRGIKRVGVEPNFHLLLSAVAAVIDAWPQGTGLNA
jgi:hypothetical protein